VTALDGGELAANSGDPAAYEGVQASDWLDRRFWHPDGIAGGDRWTDAGFPLVPGLLDAAIRPFETPALSCRWYATYGNHDGLIQGNLPGSVAFDALLTGTRKIESLPAAQAAEFLAKVFGDVSALANEIGSGVYPSRSVTADPNRRFLSTDAWVQRHLDSPAIPGPVGHGFTEAHFDLPGLFYEFEVAPGIVGLVLDTGGYNSGSIGELQLQWLRSRLEAHSSTYVGEDGREVTTGHADRLIMAFSHFPASSLNGSTGDPARPNERRVLGAEVEALFHRFDNFVAWVNGHHHTNRVTPRPDPAGRTGGYWDINTCSHVDWPQQARIIEVADNGDGTLSIFTTLVDHDSPLAPADLNGVAQLASWSRELAANDPQSNLEARLGPVDARNVEMGRRSPHRR
jgi:metallophosphoesterase (TIGR03767 family)